MPYLTPVRAHGPAPAPHPIIALGRFLTPVREAGGAGHWVTIGGGDADDAEGHGGVHVYINGSGVITKGPGGPGGLVGHHIGAVASHPSAKPVKHHPEGHVPEGAKAHPSYTEKAAQAQPEGTAQDTPKSKGKPYARLHGADQGDKDSRKTQVGEAIQKARDEAKAANDPATKLADAAVAHQQAQTALAQHRARADKYANPYAPHLSPPVDDDTDRDLAERAARAEVAHQAAQQTYATPKPAAAAETPKAAPFTLMHPAPPETEHARQRGMTPQQMADLVAIHHARTAERDAQAHGIGGTQWRQAHQAVSDLESKYRDRYGTDAPHDVRPQTDAAFAHTGGIEGEVVSGRRTSYATPAATEGGIQPDRARAQGQHDLFGGTHALPEQQDRRTEGQRQAQAGQMSIFKPGLGGQEQASRPTEEPHHATMTRDRQTGRAWLDFGGKPTEEQIAALKKDGWRYSGYRQQWHNPRKGVAPPTGIRAKDEGENTYSSERADRLDASAARAGAEATRRFDRAHEMASHIPFGQPILVGHHSEKRARADVRRIETNQAKAADAYGKAQELTRRAEGSRAAQERHDDPRVIYRRIERLKADMAPLRTGSSGWTPGPARDAKVAALQAEIDKHQRTLDAAGGLPNFDMQVQPGDHLKVGDRTIHVTGSGPKTISGKIHAPGTRLHDWPTKVGREELGNAEVIRRAAEHGGGDPVALRAQIAQHQAQVKHHTAEQERHERGEGPPPEEGHPAGEMYGTRTPNRYFAAGYHRSEALVHKRAIRELNVRLRGAGVRESATPAIPPRYRRPAAR